MAFKRVLAIFIIITIANKSVKCHLQLDDALKLIDDVMARTSPMGLLKFPVKASEYAKACDDIKGLIKSPKVPLYFAKAFIKIKVLRESSIPYIKEKVNNILCTTARTNKNEWTKFAEDINKDFEALAPIRVKYSNTLYLAAQPENSFTSSQIACFFKKWLDESVAALTSENAKKLISQYSENLMVLPKKLKPGTMCDWTDFPQVETPKLRSAEMLFFEACKNIKLKEIANDKHAQREAQRDAKRQAAARGKPVPDKEIDQDLEKDPAGAMASA